MIRRSRQHHRDNLLTLIEHQLELLKEIERGDHLISIALQISTRRHPSVLRMLRELSLLREAVSAAPVNDPKGPA